MIETGLPSLLSGVITRVYPRTPQQPTFPLVRYQRITTTRTANIDGTKAGPTEFMLQLDCMAKSYSEAKQLAKNVMDTLHTYRGAWGSYQCQFCMLESESDFEEQDGDDYTHWVSQRYVIYINEG